MEQGSFQQRTNMDQQKFYSPKNVHKPFKKCTTDKLRQITAMSNLGYSVCTLSVYGNLNVGTIMRTSQLCGANKYIIFGRKKYDKRSTCGAHHYVNVVTCDSFDKEYIKKGEYKLDPELFLQTMIDHNLCPVFLEQEPNSVLFSQINWNQHLIPINKTKKEICFVFGNEGNGIPQDILEIGKTIPGSFVITIPQLGVSKSFNVAASASIILFNFKEYMMKKRLDWIL